LIPFEQIPLLTAERFLEPGSGLVQAILRARARVPGDIGKIGKCREMKTAFQNRYRLSRIGQVRENRFGLLAEVVSLSILASCDHVDQ